MRSKQRSADPEALRVYFLPARAIGLPGSIGLSIAPGQRFGKKPARNLEADLSQLQHVYEVDILVTLLEQDPAGIDELHMLGIGELFSRMNQIGMRSERLSIKDGGAPASLGPLITLVDQLIAAVNLGQTVVLHCRDGLGRSGLVAACCLCALGASVQEALTTVRATRAGSVETATQEHCLRLFDTAWRERLLQQAQSTANVTPYIAPEPKPSHPAAQVSQVGVAPLSQSGAANLVYQGVVPEALAAGINGAAPLRDGDTFHILPGGQLIIGRSSDCDVTIRSSQLTRMHTLIAFSHAAGGQLIVVDLNSRNGTWHQGKRLTVSLLNTGDTISLAKAFAFQFHSVA